MLGAAVARAIADHASRGGLGAVGSEGNTTNRSICALSPSLSSADYPFGLYRATRPGDRQPGATLRPIGQLLAGQPWRPGRIASPVETAAGHPPRTRHMTNITPIDKLTNPLGGQQIELQQLDYPCGGMSLLRTRIREKSRFTVFEIDPLTARRWGEALLRWAQAQPVVNGPAQDVPDRDAGSRDPS